VSWTERSAGVAKRAGPRAEPRGARAKRASVSRALTPALACTVIVLATGCDPPRRPGELRDALAARAPLNVVLVVVDTLRADWTTPYGGPERASPEFARWARRGAVFERVLAQSSWTKSSMASLMTSQWPGRVGVRATTDALGQGALTVAEVFQRAGYRTYAVQSNGWLEQTFGFHQGFDHYLFPRGGISVGARPTVWPHADNVYLEAERLIDRHDPSRPFFLYLHFMDVHEYAAPSDLTGFGSGDEGAYRAAIAWVDEIVARVRERLEDRGLLERTALVLASDHGEAFGENGVRGHARNVHSQVLHVPLVIRFPFPIAPVRVSARARNLDVAPTLLELAGLDVPEPFQGESLLPWVIDPAAASDRISFASLRSRLYANAVLQVGINDGSWSFLRDTDEPGSERLFDRSVDSGENVNLVEIEPERAQSLRARLDAHLAEPVDLGGVESNIRINPGLAEKLRALGYGR
jgi:arylsulfatase A-like enzyme